MFRFLMGAGVVFVLTACNAKKDATEFLSVSFDGYNTVGQVTVFVDPDAIANELYEEDYNQLTSSEAREVAEVIEDLKIDVDKKDGLKNDDVVKVKVTAPDKLEKFKGGEKEFKVTDLKEPTVITAADIEKNLVVNFNGASGAGKAQVDNIFDNEATYVTFEIENDGKLKNGDQATIVLTDEMKTTLLSYGYIIEEGAKPIFEVKGLDEVAATAKEIANYEDVKRMVEEGIRRRYKDFAPTTSYGTRYEITLEKIMYRQFYSYDDSATSWSMSETNGTLVGVFTVKQFNTDAEGKMVSQKTVIYGYSNILLDAEKKTNVANLVEVSDEKDDTYSLESVIKLYEGYGYTEVK